GKGKEREGKTRGGRGEGRGENKEKRAGLKGSAIGKKEESGEFATMETVERIGEALLEALMKSGYVGPRKTELAEEKLRRMLRRFSMGVADAEGLLGMIRKIEARIEEEARK